MTWLVEARVCLDRLTHSADLEGRIQAFGNKCHRRMLGISYREQKKQTNMHGNRWISSMDARSFHCQSFNVASYHGSATSVAKVRCWRSYYNEQWMVFVAEEDFANHGRATSTNGQASRCRHCCASRITDVDGQSSQQMYLLVYPQRTTWASRVSVS